MNAWKHIFALVAIGVAGIAAQPDEVAKQFERDLAEWLVYVGKLQSEGVTLVSFRDYELRESLAKRAEIPECAIILKASLQQNLEAVRIARTSEKLRRFATEIGELYPTGAVSVEEARRWIRILDLYIRGKGRESNHDSKSSQSLPGHDPAKVR